jgi:branched-chain amino acid transport system ATP-binding protein
VSAPAIRLDGLQKSFGALRATDDVCLTLAEHECHAIIGPNGAGKTTLIGQITGEITPDAGRIEIFGDDVTQWPVPRRAQAGLARSFQITQLATGFTALDNVAFAVQARLGHSFRFLRDARRDPRLRGPAHGALERTGLAAQANALVEDLSHGERRQLELAVALAMQPRILLLDEPMAGMGPQESARMLAILQALKGQVTILLVEHDMDAVFALADQVSVLVNGALLTSGPADVVRNDPRVRSVYLGEGDA